MASITVSFKVGALAPGPVRSLASEANAPPPDGQRPALSSRSSLRSIAESEPPN
jgi:hypothetical protein